MGGLQAADPGNSIGGGVNRAWSYPKFLRAESTGIPVTEFVPLTVPKLSRCANSMKVSSSHGPSPYPHIPELFVSELRVMKLLQNIDTSKAVGPDLLPARILKEAAVELTPILSALFQQSYDSGLLPADWKKVNISAI